MDKKIRLHQLNFPIGITQLPLTEPIPNWVFDSPFFQLVRTPDECSVVCAMEYFPDKLIVEPRWKGFYVEGPLDFSLTGILHQITSPLAKAAIPIFAISTFLTDYVLVREMDWGRAIEALGQARLEVLD